MSERVPDRRQIWIVIFVPRASRFDLMIVMYSSASFSCDRFQTRENAALVSVENTEHYGITIGVYSGTVLISYLTV